MKILRKNLKVKLTIIIFASIVIGVFIYKNYRVNNKTEEIIINNKSIYNASEEIKEALAAVDANKKVEIISNVDSPLNMVAVSFDGLSNKDTMLKITDLLKRYGVKATFFIPGIKAAENTDIVKIIQESGQEIGSGTLSGTKNMESLSKKELVTDFCRSNKILKTITGKEPILLKCNSTIYNDNVLTTAYASGNKYIVSSDHYLSFQSFKNYNQAYEYIRNVKSGTLISIKLEGVLDSSEYVEKRKEEKPTVNKETGLNKKNEKQEEKVDIVQIVEWLLKSMNEQNKIVASISELSDRGKYAGIQKNISMKGYNKNNKLKNKEVSSYIDLVNYKEIIEKNNKRLAPVVSQFFTTQKSLAYTFRGLSNEAILDKVLKMLQKHNAKGTFFVTKDEILKYPDRINKILSAGHEVGNGGITTGSNLLNKSPEEICKEIYEVDKLLKDKGISTNAYMPGYGYVDSEVQEALSAITAIPSFKNYELFTYSKAPIIQKYKDMNAEKIAAAYFDINSYVSLRKGEIVYFRLDSELFNDSQVIANLIELLTENYVQNGYAHKYNEESQSYYLAQKPLGYSVVTLSDLQNTIEIGLQLGRYQLINNPTSIVKRSYEDATKMINTKYIGNRDVDLSDFNENEKFEIDRTGLIDTKGESVIFFTFDDWGGDPIINEILDVLNKHKVKAGFFTISKYTDVNSGISNINPNLLRTIALNGHDIGSHNYNHELLEANREELEVSLIKSYDVMANIIGDLDSLRPYFRPPTLLLRREGLEAVFESGYKYSVSGNISTHDYESSSAQEIVDYIQEGLVKGKGNIVVMHMNNQSYYTAEALDIFLANNEKGLYGDKYKVAKLSDYLEK